jgi:hypothetical protein
MPSSMLKKNSTILKPEEGLLMKSNGSNREIKKQFHTLI